MKVGFFIQGAEHLGVEYLSAVLKQAGHTTELFFEPRIWRDGYLYHEGLGNLFNTEDMIVEEMLNANLDMLAFSVSTDNFATAKRVAGKVRQHDNITTVFGGIHCTSVPERVVVKPEIDYVVVGEGEYPLLELVNALENGDRYPQIQNLWYQKPSNDVVAGPTRPVIEDLDELPFIDKEIFYAKAPGVHHKRYVTVASRGCIYSCTFCNNSMYKTMYNKAKLGKWQRRRSVDNVIAEMKQAYDKYQYEFVYFWDEIFIDDKEWLKEFSDKYASAIGKPFWCYGYARFINEETVEMLEHAGCRDMNIGVQTIRPESRKIIKRGDRNEKIAEAIRLVGESKMCLQTGNILQLPGQPLEEALELAEFYSDNKVNLPIVGFLRYYPRTEIVNTGLKYGSITQEDVERIEEAEEENPLLVGNDQDDKLYRKVQMLVQMTPLFPPSVIKYLIRSGRWKNLPVGTVMTMAMVWFTHFRTNILQGKTRLPENYTLRQYLPIVIGTGVKKAAWKLKKFFGNNFTGPLRALFSPGKA